MTDGMELDTVAIFTRSRLRESEGIEWPQPLLAQLHRIDGVVLEVSFTSLANAARFVRDMSPHAADVFCGRDEDAQTICDAMNATAH